MKPVFAAAFALILLAGSTAFAQRADRNVDMPIVRSFHWFDYVGGDDIRQACGKDGRNRLRLIYNAIYDEQVRSYEIFLQPDGTAGLSMGVLANQGNVTNLLVADPGDVFNPWRMRRGERILSADETRDLMGLLRAAARRTAPAGCGFLVDGRVVPQRRLGLSGLPLSDRRFRKREVRGPAFLLGYRADSGQSAPQARAGGTAPRPQRPAQPLEVKPVDPDGGEGLVATEVAESRGLPI